MREKNFLKLQLNAVLDSIEIKMSIAVLSVPITGYQNKLELLPVLLVQKEHFLIRNKQVVVMFFIFFSVIIILKTSRQHVDQRNPLIS